MVIPFNSSSKKKKKDASTIKLVVDDFNSRLIVAALLVVTALQLIITHYFEGISAFTWTSISSWKTPQASGWCARHSQKCTQSLMHQKWWETPGRRSKQAQDEKRGDVKRGKLGSVCLELTNQWEVKAWWCHGSSRGQAALGESKTTLGHSDSTQHSLFECSHGRVSFLTQPELRPESSNQLPGLIGPQISLVLDQLGSGTLLTRKFFLSKQLS